MLCFGEKEMTIWSASHPMEEMLMWITEESWDVQCWEKYLKRNKILVFWEWYPGFFTFVFPGYTII
jgi:hypothetical protein